jgi:RimJ/RimL family protein N-acetyltransferase
MPVIALRPIVDADADDLFRMMSDPESVRMAAFVSGDPTDRARFDERLARHRLDPEITQRAITWDGRLAGSIASFVIEGDTELTYWIDRPLWGRGIAGEALRMFLEIVPVRPLHARAASDNEGSLRVLQKAGFKIQGTETGYADARHAEVEETILRLDAPDSVR